MSADNLKDTLNDLIRHPALSEGPERFARSIYVLLFVIGIVCFWELGGVELLDLVDEGTYATVARHMLESGDWVTPRIGADIFFYKPPLMYWCQAFFMSILGFTPLASRLPSAVAAALTALLLYYWAKRNGSSRVGWLAGVFYILCPLTAIGLARISMMDSLLTLFLTLAVIGWIGGYRGNRKGYYLMAVAIGLATMTKGMIGFLLPGAGFAVWLVLRRDWHEFRNFPWLSAIIIFCVIVIPWHFAVWRVNGDFFIQEYIVRQHFSRFMGQDSQHNMDLHVLPFWYYLPVTILAMFPFGFFVPASWWRGLKGWKSDRQSIECEMSIWAIWAIIVIGFFSADSSKLPSYILPALPALTMLAAWRLDSLWTQKNGLSSLESLTLWISSSIPGVILLVVGILGWQWRFAPSEAPQSARIIGKVLNWKQYQSVEILWQKLNPITVLAPYWIVLGTMFLFCLGLFITYRKSPSRVVFTTISMSIVMLVVLVHTEFPLWAANWVPLKEMSLRTLPALERQEPLVLYSMRQPRPLSIRYILGHNEFIYETQQPGILQSVLDQKGHGYVILVKGTELPALAGTFRQEAAGGKWTLWRYDDPLK